MLDVLLRITTIMALAIFGNLFLMFVIKRGNAMSRQRISPVQLLLLHTCTADLLFALLTLGTQIIMLITHPHFYAPDAVCRLVRYLQALPLYASPFLMVAISIDRYQAICRPLVHYRSDRFRRPNCLGLSAWFLALLCSAPQLLIWRKDAVGAYKTGEFVIGGGQVEVDEFGFGNVSVVVRRIINTTNNQECHTIYGSTDPDLWKCVYVAWFSTVAWLLPSLVSGTFYFRVCTTVWKSRFWSRSDDDALQVHSAAPTPKTLTADYDPKATAARASSCQLTRDYVESLRKSSTGFRNQVSEFDRKRIQTVRLTLTIVICNFFLWLPFCAINVIQAFSPRLLSANIIIYIVVLGNLNACVNPWIYILFNQKITRRALSSVVRGRAEPSSGAASATRQTSVALRLTPQPPKHNNAKPNGNI